MHYVLYLIISLICFSVRADTITIMEEPFDGFDFTHHSYDVDKVTGEVQIVLTFNKPSSRQESFNPRIYKKSIDNLSYDEDQDSIIYTFDDGATVPCTRKKNIGFKIDGKLIGFRANAETKRCLIVDLMSPQHVLERTTEYSQRMNKIVFIVYNVEEMKSKSGTSH